MDASVVAKWLAPEADSHLAEVLLDDELIAPDLLFAEVGNILWKRQQRGEIDATVSLPGARWLLQVPLQVHDSAALLPEALALAQRLRHPADHCFYLALAQRVDAPLCTADRRLHARCQAADAEGWAARVQLLQAG